LSLILFDIDGTLLLSGGAGVRGMTRAFEQLFGVADAFATIEVAGRTDTYLLSRALRGAGLSDTAENRQRFRDAYLAVLEEEIHHPGKGRRGVMPGVLPLLDRLREDGAFHVALLTGNYERAAQIKLAHFGLAGFFGWGAFGEDSEDRNELGRLALRRAEERAVPMPARTRAIVVGDTPYDVACARAIGARALAVATGSHSIEQLQQAGADAAVADLSDIDYALRVLR
jgi:phosphoglycolate phosphatase-like HAD superfamily hydrolase